MSTITYSQRSGIHQIVKSLKVDGIRYRLQTSCLIVHKSFKRDNKKENDEIKNEKIKRKNKKE